MSYSIAHTLLLIVLTLAGAARDVELRVTASFEGKASIAAGEPFDLQLSRPVAAGEGRMAVVIGATDVTDLFTAGTQSLHFESKAFPIPPGETAVEVYLVTLANDWKEIARFPLRVVAPTIADAAQISASPDAATTPAPTADSSATGANGPAADAQPTQAAPAPVVRRFGFDKLDLAPTFNIGFKSQFAETHFPDASRPERPTFADATLAATWKSEMARGAFNMQHGFDLVGSSFRNEALRFGELGGNALKLDLSSYQMQFQHGTRKMVMGHSSYGSHRHLINNFGSRGFTMTVPLGKRFDLTGAAMNSTNIVGFSNFAGLANNRHRLFSGIIGFEALEKRPGGLRFEAGASEAWFLSNRQNFNQGNINDAERSQGGSVRVLAKNKTDRARLDAGFTRSRFFNPDDPLLQQQEQIISSTRTTRNARYADVTLDLLKDFSFRVIKPAALPAPAGSDAPVAPATAQEAQARAEPKKLNLTLSLRHERVDPLFKSIGASTQADLQQNQAEFTGSFGELSFNLAHARSSDNLAGIQTILRTNTRRTAVSINSPLQGLFGTRVITAPNPLFPRIGYSFEQTRASADFIPLGGEFDQPGAIPDLTSTNQSFTVEWQFKEVQLAYRLNHTLQDNRAFGRERADLRNFVHNMTIGWKPRPTLDLNLDVNFEDANNREQMRTDRTLRFGVIANWQASARQAFNLTFSTLGAGDLARTSDNRNIEFDLQWNYKLTRENENRFKKFQAIYFIRYANRFARTNDFSQGINTLTKLQTFNTGLNFIFF